uniref:Variant surface glycoprotein 1125.16 n=1 Tax=Trypanosoma brucei TaxID=5691 RepID=A0A1J0R436_9TRYP|nr:variant surface glycoprotein 1125.16 [Trypanosoma brucei]
MPSSNSKTAHLQAAVLIQLIALCLLATIVNGATNPGDNAGEFKAMCQLVKLATLKPEDAATDQEAIRDQDDLNVLNLTLAPETWQEKFGDGAEGHKWDNVKAKYEGQKQTADWQQRWDLWLSIAAKKKEKESNEKFKADYAAPKSSIARSAAAAQVAKYAEAAGKLRSAYDKEISSLNGEEKKTIVTHLTKALYNKNGEPDNKGEVPKQKFPDAQRQQDDCKGSKVGDNIRYDLMCLCAGTLAGHSKACTTTALTKAWVATSGHADTAADTIIEKCQEGAALPLTADNIEHAVNTLQSLIGIHAAGNNKGHYLGIGNACAGDDGNLCVEYDEYYKEGEAKKGTTMPWMQNMLTAAKLLRQREKKITQNERRAGEIKGLSIMAKAAIKGAQAHPESDTQKSSDEPKPTQEAISCSNHKTNATCAAANCKWDSTTEVKGEHCKPKEPKGQTDTAAGTGEGAAGTTANTTGSNSFVINKSPLLLAFLLF